MTREIFTGATVQLERSVIGAVLLYPEILETLPLMSSHFAHMPARVIWEAICNVRDKGQTVDTTTVGAQLDSEGKYDAVGGHAELGLCVIDVPSPTFAIDYAAEIRNQALHRQVMVALSDGLAKAREGTAFGKDLLGEVMGTLSRMDAEDVHDETMTIADLTKEHVKRLEAMTVRKLGEPKPLTGAPTGITKLDVEIGGWQYGILSAVCARPKHGKSSFMLATTDACTEAGIGTHIFSLEDPRQMYTTRVIARIARIPSDAIATATFTRDERMAFAQAHHTLTKKRRPWIVDDRSGITASDIVRSVRRHRKENGTRVVIVDYLQLLKREDGRNGSSRHEQITESIHVLADAAKNDGMAYIVCSQLNRGVEQRDDKRPVESDMRESGTIEERAKCIIGVYRGAAYGGLPLKDIDVDEDGELLSYERFQTAVQLLVLKNSQGASPLRVLAHFHGPTTRMS